MYSKEKVIVAFPQIVIAFSISQFLNCHCLYNTSSLLCHADLLDFERNEVTRHKNGDTRFPSSPRHCLPAVTAGDAQGRRRGDCIHCFPSVLSQTPLAFSIMTC